MFTNKNFVLFGISLILLVIGFIFLGQGPVDSLLSKSLAPIILVFTYCILVPYAIMAGFKRGDKKE